MSFGNSQVQTERAEASVAIAEANADMAAQQIALEQQKLAQREKFIKYGGIALAVLLAIKILKK